MGRWLAVLRRFLDSEDGATATEYAVMIALIILVCFAAVSALGDKVSSVFTDAEAEWTAVS